MKTRIIQTRFWDDEFITEASKETRYLYIFLLTSQYINISGIFQLSDRKIQFETGLTPKEYEKAMQELQKNEKAFFYAGWVYIVNARKNNNYENSPKNVTACEKELERVPEEVKQHFLKCLNTSIDSTMHTSIDTSIDTSMDSSHKSKIINNKSKIIKKNNDVQKFEEFWEKYPRKVNKKKSEQKYLNILRVKKKDEDVHSDIMKGLENYLPRWQQTEAKFIPHATTWLNGERWKDQVEASPKRFESETSRPYDSLF